jgi:hypothetical protein
LFIWIAFYKTQKCKLAVETHTLTQQVEANNGADVTLRKPVEQLNEKYQSVACANCNLQHQA